MTAAQAITHDDYVRFRTFLEKACGIVLGDGKEYLIVSRLAKLLRDEDISSVAELLTAVERGHPRHLRDVVIDAMTTNETSWFRDRSPFEVLENEVLPEMDANGIRQCRIWSSACSSGQEPYTISITLSEYLRSAPTSGLANAQVIATDISTSMLVLAKQAEYDNAILGRGLSEQRKKAFFKPVGDRWIVADDIRRRVSFKEQNLLLSYAALGKFDIIFCRNVLIYFSSERKTDILNRMAAALNPGGYLFLGASETITGYSDAFEMVRSPHGVFYRLKR
ncbi:MAG: protein-glutamate O-methyltransferase CheR [Gammaproteobacteria bacterium]|nr:protein-glutamate O-methyltransferase CheR [Gammaproteobacteria bacterium]MDH5592519.1 protein-glutamate O-methyltransferase CheR [Gammaproteobacteria bacterium]